MSEEQDDLYEKMCPFTPEDYEDKSKPFFTWCNSIQNYLNKGHMYTIRLDVDMSIPKDKNIKGLKQIMRYLESPLYSIFFEYAEKTKKPHYQGYFFRLKEITKNTQEKHIAKYFKENFPHYTGTRRSISPLAKLTYYSYCAKQKNKILEKFPSDIDPADWYDCIPSWKEADDYKTSKNKSLKNDIFSIPEDVIDDEDECIERIVMIFVTHRRGFTYYDIISKYNVLRASRHLKEVVSEIRQVMKQKQKLDYF